MAAAATAAAEQSAPASLCPRCGAGFHCGATDAAPCACFALALSPALVAQLRAEYTQCLCIGCLQQLQHEATAAPG